MSGFSKVFPTGHWEKLPYRSDTGGVRPMFLEGRMKDEIERRAGMTPEERKYRKQWLKDQTLTSREPVIMRDYYVELNNPIRRFYKYPFRKLEEFCIPRTGPIFATLIRRSARNLCTAIAFTYLITYVYLYRQHTWERFGGWRFQHSKPYICPGDKGYPYVSDKKYDDFADWGFKSSPLANMKLKEIK